MTGVYPDSMADTIVDDSESFWQVQAVAGWPNGLCEGAFYQTDDRVLHMLLRTNTERLWLTESSDDGTTWSPRSRQPFCGSHSCDVGSRRIRDRDGKADDEQLRQDRLVKDAGQGCADACRPRAR
jgi:hypothetical protein